MSFEVSGTYRGEPVRASWTDGAIDAPAPVLAELRARVGYEVQVPGLISEVLDLAEPLSVVAGLTEVLDAGRLEWSGEVPPIAPLEPGAIA